MDGKAAQSVTPLLILLVTEFLYLNTLYAGFHFDDFRIIVDNPVFNFSTLSVSTLVDVITNVRARPVTMATFVFNYAIGGKEVVGYHLVNMLLHGLTGVALYLLLLFTLTTTPGGRIGLGPTILPQQIAGWTSLLWVAHPIQTQAVTYIAQRASALAALFYLLTLLCYLRGRLTHGRARVWWYLAGVAMAGLAMGSKETAITLPFALWLYEASFFTPPRRSPFRWHATTLLLVLGLTAVIGMIYVYGAYGGVQPLIQLFSGMNDPYRDVSLWERFLTKGRVVVFYLSLLVVPFPSRLNIDHDMAWSSGLWSPASTLPAWLMVGAAVVLAIRLLPRRRLLGFGLIWFFLNIALESSLVSHELIFEHRLYLPSMGFMVVLVVLVNMLAARMAATRQPAQWSTIFTWGMLASLLVGYGAWTIERNRVWANDITLWEDAALKSPKKFRPHLNVGYAYEQAGAFRPAEREYQSAKQLDPSAFKPYYNLGWIYYKQQLWGQAAAELEQALALRLARHSEAIIRHLLGKVHLGQGQEVKAMEQWRRAYWLEPGLAGLAEDLRKIERPAR